MKCRNPYLNNGMAYGCGQCMPCRLNKKRIWTHRIMLESYEYSDNTMVTLTYDDEHLPRLDDGRGTLVPKDFQDWLKRFRKAVEPRRVRYFGVGEYGDQLWRPHYHVILFNYPTCSFGLSRYSKTRVSCCSFCDIVRDTWRNGGVYLNEVNESTSQYVCGYVTKKMVQKDDYRLRGLHPEFARMSLKPGIGANFMHEVASSLMQYNLEDSTVDVPSTLRHGGRIFPLGRYLQRRLRLLVGKDQATPQYVLDQIAAELQPLREAAFDGSRSFKEEIVKAADQAVLNMEVKQKIFRQRKDKL